MPNHPPAGGSPIVHTVAKGEYLFKILRTNGFSEGEAHIALALMAKDPKAYGITSGNAHVIYPGDTITLPQRETLQVDLDQKNRAGDLRSSAMDTLAETSRPELEGSLGRLATMLDLFNVSDDPGYVGLTHAASQKVAAKLQQSESERQANSNLRDETRAPKPDPTGRTTITAGELMGKRRDSADKRKTRVPDSEEMRTAIRDPMTPPPRRRQTFVPLVKEEDAAFEYQVDDNGFNLFRRFNTENPVLWMNYMRCSTCRVRTCKLCILLKYLSASELWESIAGS